MPDASPFRLLPELDDTNRHFWTGGAEGELRFLRCIDCRTWLHPPSPRCPNCLSVRLAVEASSGRGRIHTFTVNHQQWNPLINTPYVIAIVELDDQKGLRLMTNIVGSDPSTLEIEQPVEVVFEAHGEVHLPTFRLVSGTP